MLQIFIITLHDIIGIVILSLVILLIFIMWIASKYEAYKIRKGKRKK